MFGFFVSVLLIMLGIWWFAIPFNWAIAGYLLVTGVPAMYSQMLSYLEYRNE